MRIFDRRYETMPRTELEQLQLERLQALLARLRRNVRRYREQIADGIGQGILEYKRTLEQ